MRSLFVLLALAVVLGGIAFIARSGIISRDDPGKPINSAMREALAARSPQWSQAEAAVLARDFSNARETKTGMRYFIRALGTGEETPKVGQWASVHYEGRFFDGTNDRGQGPFNFQVGLGRVIPGWDEAILGMKRGEKRTLAIPYWLAYGEKGVGSKIPPKAGLIFQVELIDFR
jgi:FKBP-type peptidyl-prolyl cis-trans isomerase